MIRTQIQLDEATYERIKNRAFSEKRSMAALIREAVDEYLKVPQKPKRKLTIGDFTFIGSGRSDPNEGPWPLSERHDDALADSYER